MTIKELKEFIKDLPDDMKVVTSDSEYGTEESNLSTSTISFWHEGKIITEEVLVVS